MGGIEVRVLPEGGERRVSDRVAEASGRHVDGIADGRHAPIGRCPSAVRERDVVDPLVALPVRVDPALHDLDPVEVRALGVARGLNEETGRIAAELGIDWLIAVGEHAPLVIEGAREAGMSADQGLVASGTDEAAHVVRQRLQKNDWVLIKGSRAMKLERVVHELLQGSE